jgi:hypothetical protein
MILIMKSEREPNLELTDKLAATRLTAIDLLELPYQRYRAYLAVVK